MKKLRVPASTANVGSGFDSIGIALALYNHVEFEACDQLQIESVDEIPKGKDNLIVSTIAYTFEQAGRPFKGVHLIQENNVPMSRGLGSSSTCIAAGVTIADELMGNILSLSDKVDIAALIEGHPDNVAPALLGGFVAAVIDNGHVTYHQKPLSRDELCFIVVVPDFCVSTHDAREALPKTFPMADAVFNLSRSSLCTAAFLTGNYDLLRVATKDRLHQKYRLQLIRGGEEIMDRMLQLGAFSATVSGAGPSLLAIVPATDNAIYTGLVGYIAREFPAYRVLRLYADNRGVTVMENA
ncbi:Homoserine kinase [bioreactor metagenome]|uniref:Homoserine kinase n=1 Tax=bioreactor metagenome TaxID=1076179 RepID=A0A644XTT3_9ZZZZ